MTQPEALKDIVPDPLRIRAAIWHHINDPKKDPVSDGLIGAAYGCLKEALMQAGYPGADLVAEQNRHLVYGLLFTPDNEPMHEIGGADLTPEQRYALYRWAKPVKIEDAWRPRQTFYLEAHWCLNLARKVAGRTLDIEPDRPIKDLLAEYKDQMPPVLEADQSAVSVLPLGGVPVQMPLEQVGEPYEIHWCHLCGERPSAPGQPCKTCRELDADDAEPVAVPQAPKAWPKRKQ